MTYRSVYDRFDRAFPEVFEPNQIQLKTEFMDIILNRIQPSKLEGIQRLPNSSEIIRRGKEIRERFLREIRNETREYFSKLLLDADRVKKYKDESVLLRRELAKMMGDNESKVSPTELREVLSRVRRLLGDFSSSANESFSTWIRRRSD